MRDKILIIEDDLALRPLWEVIARRNFGVENMDWAVSAEEGQRLFSEALKINPYAVIVVDIFLAGSDTGLDFVRHARSLGQKIPILLVSTVSAEDLEENFETELEPVIILGKPLNVPKCERVLEQILHHRSA